MADEHDGQHGGGDQHAEGHAGGHGGHGGGHGGGSHEEHEGAPEWLISFADNVALMMGFFVILLAMNMKEVTTGGIGGKQDNGGAPDNNTKMVDFVISVREAFHNEFDLNSRDPAEEVFRKRIKERKEGQSKQPENSGESREHQSRQRPDLSSLGGTVAFDDEAGELSPSGKGRAEEIGRS